MATPNPSTPSTSTRGDRVFLVGIVALMLFLARRTFRAGLWSDNDSVCHYAYLRHLLEEIHPQTGSVLAYSPTFNLGVPFLVYNTPPGLYVASAIVSTVLHVSALAGLKIVVVAAYASVPLIGYALARTFEDAPPHTPRFVALMLAVSSAELFGTWFYFRNGMLNAAVAIPLLLATLTFFRRAQVAPFPKVLREVAIGALVYGVLVSTHLLSAYMTVVAIACFIAARGAKNVGLDVVRAGALLALGGAIAAFWVIPSAPFAPEDDAVYTWMRPPLEELLAFLDGSLLASNFGGFFLTHRSVSNAGIVAVVFGVVGAIFAFRRFKLASSRGPLSCLLAFATAFWITLGPTCSIGLRWLLPSYDRLLWYRFLTLGEVGWLVLAGYGAASLAVWRPRVWAQPALRAIVLLAFVWPFLNANAHAITVETTSDYGRFVADTDHIAAQLKQRFQAKERRGRVYSEFVAAADEQPPSVNYTRHMIPIQSGVPEVAGWVYENNLAGRLLQKRGTFWNNPLPFVDDAERFDVMWIVASSPHLIRALRSDPRWKPIEETRSLVLFEHATYEPRLAEGRGLAGIATERRYLRGGGYEYAIDLSPSPAVHAKAPFVVKVGYLPRGFTVWADDRPLAVRPSPDGLLEVDLPEGAKPARLRVVWQIDDAKKTGDRITLVGLAIAAALIVLSLRKKAFPEALFRLGRPLQLAGIAIAILAPIVVVVRGRVDLSRIGFGVRDGIEQKNEGLTANVGTYDDERWSALVHVLPRAWSPRRLEPIDGALRPARLLAAVRSPFEPAFVAAFAQRGESSITIDGLPARASIMLKVFERRGEEPVCTLTGNFGEPIPVASACLEKGAQSGELPGITREIRITPLEADLIKVTRINVKTSIRIVEAESLANVLDDNGRDAFYALGRRDYAASSGLTMSAWPTPGPPTELRGRVDLSGNYEVFALARVVRDDDSAELVMLVGGMPVGRKEREGDGMERPAPSADDPIMWEWRSIGTINVMSGGPKDLRVRLKRRPNSSGAIAELDAFAFVAR